MDKINEQRIEELESTIKRAQEQIEEIKREASTPKIKYPNIDDTVWIVDLTGNISVYTWYGTPVDIQRFNQGHIFFTKQEAEFEVERRNVISELNIFAIPKNRKWDKSELHYYIEYNYSFDLFEFDYTYSYRHNDIYFASEEDAQKAIDYVGVDRVKKYFLGVEE